MTTHQAFIEFARLAESRLAPITGLTVSTDPEVKLNPPYFYIHTGPERRDGFVSSIIVLGRLVVGREQLSDTTWRDLADTGAYYQALVAKLMLGDGADTFEKVDRRQAGNPRTGNYKVRHTATTGDLSKVDDVAEYVFTFELRTINS